MEQLWFRFYGPLNEFLSPHRRQVEFFHWLKEPAAVKDTIEALGVPHTEVDLILINGQSEGFYYLLKSGDRVSVFPYFTNLDIAADSRVRPPPPPSIRFVVDVHLGKLATYLRLLGFDVLYRNDYSDEELAAISCLQERILLTQDRPLLKRRIVTYGYFVRSQTPKHQIIEVLQRFDLFAEIMPYRRCLRCNGLLERVDKASVADQIPPYTRLFYHDFSRCQSCAQIYWQGAHHRRIQQLIDDIQPSVGSGVLGR